MDQSEFSCSSDIFSSIFHLLDSDIPYRPLLVVTIVLANEKWYVVQTYKVSIVERIKKYSVRRKSDAEVEWAFI